MGGCLSSNKQNERYEPHSGAARGSPVTASTIAQRRTHSITGGGISVVLPTSPTGYHGSPSKAAMVGRIKSAAARKSSNGGELRAEVLNAMAVSRHGSILVPRRSQERGSLSVMQSGGSLILGTPKTRYTPEQLEAQASRSSSQQRKNSVGADLHSIMDEHGMLSPLVARQMSVMSHYSVRSQSGSVLITPQQKASKPEFQLQKLIGRGGFGNVYLGEWTNHHERVAVKIIQGFNHADQPDEQEWEARKERMAQMEAVLMSAIAHDNIVRTLKVIAYQGDAVDPEMAAVEKQLLKNYLPPGSKDNEEHGPPSFEWHILMEYCDRGSLSRALSNFMLHTPIDSQTVAWDVWSSLEIMKEVTRSLIFLHDHRILHGDLKAANVLLTSSSVDRRKYIAKVSDFGLSRVLGANKNHIKTQTFGTVTHVPPELLAKGTLSAKADVYAIGVLLWEIYTAEKVFKQLSDSEVILAVVTKKARPTFPPDVPSRYKFLAERCWSEMMELRPSLQVVMKELDNLQKALCPDGEATPPIPCKVFPTRQKALAEYVAKQKQAAAAKEAAREAQTASSSGPAMTAGQRLPSVTLPGSPRVDASGPSINTRAPPSAARVASAVAAAAAASPRSPLSGQARDTERPGPSAKSGGGSHMVEVSQGSYNVTSQPARGGPGQPSALQLGPRLNSSTGATVSPGPPSPGHGGRTRSSAGRTLSPLAPQHAGSPDRINSELSVQRPADPRDSSPRDMLPGSLSSPFNASPSSPHGSGSGSVTPKDVSTRILVTPMNSNSLPQPGNSAQSPPTSRGSSSLSGQHAATGSSAKAAQQLSPLSSGSASKQAVTFKA